MTAPAWAESVSFTDLFARAEAFHTSPEAAEERVLQAKGEQAKIFAKMLPQVSAEASNTRRTETKTTVFGPVRPKESTNTSLTVRQTLFTGGRAGNQYKIASIALEAARIGHRQARETLLFDLAEAWFAMLTADENLSTVSDRLDGMRRHLEAAKARVRLGADVRASALRLESEVAQLEAEKLAAENDLAAARDTLAALTGVEVGTDTGVELGTGPVLTPIEEIGDPIATALNDRPDINILLGETAAARLAVKYANGALLPVITLEGVYTTEDQTPQISFAPDEDAFASLTATWDLFVGGENNAERRRARAAFREKQLELTQRQRDIEVEVNRVVREVAAARRIADALENAMTYATENHRIVTETYKAGAATYLDVIDASNTLGDARRNLATARFNHSLALLRLGAATGHLLELAGEAVPDYGHLRKKAKRLLQ